jgi:hypothetical protein
MNNCERFKYYVKNWGGKHVITVPEFVNIFQWDQLFYYKGITQVITILDNAHTNPGWWWGVWAQGEHLLLNIPCLTLSSDGINNKGLPAIAKVRFIDDAGGSILAPLDYYRHWGPLGTLHTIDINWESKKSECIWRGVTSGDFSRFIFITTYFEKYNVGFTVICQNKEAYSAYLRPTMSIDDMLQYKYQISIPGNDKDSGLNWKLASNSVVLMANPKIESWLMEGLLKPYVHYVPLKDDYSDLDEILDWCKSNDAACKEIVTNAQQFMKQFQDFNNEILIFDMIKDHYKNNITLVE